MSGCHGNSFIELDMANFTNEQTDLCQKGFIGRIWQKTGLLMTRPFLLIFTANLFRGLELLLEV